MDKDQKKEKILETYKSKLKQLRQIENQFNFDPKVKVEDVNLKI